MHPINQAILLLAGRGRRLGSLTEDCPKCLLEVAGMPILERSLRALSQSGVSSAVFVVGHQADQIRHFVGSQYAGIEITYLFNSQYAKTNTAYSLWLARNYLNKECLLLEGDILFNAETLERILHCTSGQSVWAALPIEPGKDEGILLQRNKSGYVEAVHLVRHPEKTCPNLSYKCAGIQVLTAQLARRLAVQLEAVINRGQVRIFADVVLGEILNETPMKLCSLEGLSWDEVDDLEDLRRARQRFEVSYYREAQ